MVKIQDITDAMATYLDKPDFDLVKKAYDFAVMAHGDQKRASGEPYIVHPIGVAQILTEMKMDSITIAAGLLHDVAEDTEYTLEDIRKKFGGKVAVLVEGVTKIESFNFENRKQASLENFRKMFLLMAEHVRVVFIKLADRLYNMRTLQYLPPTRRSRIASETMDIYAPLAERLGMGQITGELNDLSFKYIEPKVYERVEREMAKAVKQREKNAMALIELLEKNLAKDMIKVEKIAGRAKHVYSTFKKLERVGGDITKVYDLIAVRIIVADESECYKALGVIHALFKPLMGTFKDYISIPKPNGYRSLHTTVFGIDGQITEVQIRTREMHDEAEGGLAAHWYYSEIKKEKSKQYADNASRSMIKTPEERMDWVKALSDWQKNVSLPEFEEHLKIDLFKHRILAMSPKGDLYDLPEGSTPVDFAFMVHSELGYRITGATINNKMVSLSHHLHNRDVVELLVAKVPKGPSLDWLNFVKTSHAKSQIRAWFKKLNRDKNIALGKKHIEEEIEKITLHDGPQTVKKLADVARLFNLKAVEDLYAEVGVGEITSSAVMRRLIAKVPEVKKKGLIKKIPQGGLIVMGSEGIKVKLGSCCGPKTGDAVVGYITRGRGVTAHKVKCKNALKLEKERIVPLAWNMEKAIYVPIRIIGKNRVGLLSDITNQISTMGVNITDVASRAVDSHTSELNLTIEIEGPNLLLDVFRKIEQIADVKQISRI